LLQYVHQNPYAFFKYLYAENRQEPTRFIQSRWSMIYEEMLGLAPRGRDESKEGILFRRVSDLSMTAQALAGKPSALVHMPIPEQQAEAFFVGIVLCAPNLSPETWLREVQARVFTLEAEEEEGCAGQTNSGVCCEWTKEGQHRNFGFSIRVQPDLFLDTIATLLQRGDSPTAGV
jgi:hypothetical protein